MRAKRVIILGAAGRDFHNFNVYFRDNPAYRVVAFTATQIPNIEGRRYPPELAGSLYPAGIPIHPEKELDSLIRQHRADEVVFAYSDVPHTTVMHKASQVLALGADFCLLGVGSTALQSRKPTIAVCAVRTGAGKSQTTRHVCDLLREMGKRPVVVRHPMPYGDLAAQAVQRFATYADLDKHKCTIEEREEYEPLLERGTVVYAGVDYAAILHQAEEEGDTIVWDGGNNDLPFYRPDLHIVVADPHRPGHELGYHPGEANLRAADVVIVNKVDTAERENVNRVRENVRSVNPQAMIVEAASPISVEDPAAIRDKRVLVVEDGPTLTHGEMAYGAGVVAARQLGAAELVDPRPHAAHSIGAVFDRYPHIGPLLPAMGYGDEQIRDLEQTINNTVCDLVLIATPIDLRRLIDIRHPVDRVRYELEVVSRPTLEEIVGEWASGRMNEWANGRMGGWADGRMGEWANGRLGEWADGRMGKRASEIVQRNSGYWLRLVRFALVALAAGLLTAAIGSAVLGGAAYAHALTHPGCGDTGTTPADVGIAGVQDVAYPTHDSDLAGRSLRAWYLRPENGAVVILLPGLGGGRDGMLREGAILSRHGYGLLMTEMRSCIHPRGQTTLGYHEARDLENAVTWVLDQPGVEHVGVLGYSLGGVTATLGSARDERIEAVVAEGGFYDLAADITNQGGKNNLWERMLHQTILAFFRIETGVSARDVSPISVIDQISPRPLLLIYGELEAGETHPHEQLARAGEPKDLWIVPGAWHGGYLDVAAEEWEKRVITFFDTAFDDLEEQQ